MKLNASLYFLLLAFIVSYSNASERAPVAVSPGSDVGVAVVDVSCPTFSWTAVEWAKEYKIEVFEAISDELLSYEQISAIAYPILSKEIHGRALSWTPSSDKKLNNGSLYVWYVKAKDAYGTAKWSEGKSFIVKMEDRLVGIIDKVTDTLKANGVSDDVVSEILKEISSEVDEVDIGRTNPSSDGYKTQEKIGILGHEVGFNTWYGEYAGMSLTTGNFDTFIGQSAGRATTSGSNNAFLGQSAGRNNSTGSYNTFLGQFAGYTNTTANNNTFLGQRAGYSNDAGQNNTFVGTDAGNANTSGNQNTFVGQYAGNASTTGNGNIFIGQAAGYSNSTGFTNTYIGQAAGFYNIEGYYNTFLGSSAGLNNSSGDSNTFIGRGAGENNETGRGNVFVGCYAGAGETGSEKLYIDNSNTSSPLIYGDFANDMIGINGRLGVGTQSPGYDLEIETTGRNAVLLLDRTDGAKAGYAAYGNMALLGTVTNHPLMLGVNYVWRMRLNSDNSLEMANGAQCTAGGVWQDASSRAYKENILDLTTEEAKDTLLKLSPVKYNYINDKEDEHLGFIAEDVPDLVASKDRKGMSPMDVVAVLTKVVQEQQDTIAELQKRISKLEKKSQ